MKIYCVKARNVKLARTQLMWFARGRSAEIYRDEILGHHAGWEEAHVVEEDIEPTQDGVVTLLNRVAMEE